MLVMRDDWGEVDAARAAWGDDLDLAWMPVGDPLPPPVPTFSYVGSRPDGVPDSNVGPFLLLGMIVLWVVMLLSLR